MLKNILILLSVALFASATSPKIGVRLSKSLDNNPGKLVDIFVSFSGIKSPLSQVSGQNIADRGQRATVIHETLMVHSQNDQKLALELLQSRGFNDIKSFWINNQLYIKNADREIISQLTTLNSVTSVEADIVTYLRRPRVEGVPMSRNASIQAEWNVEKMGVHLVWDVLGIDGEGITVGFIDTGVRGTHEAIRDQYKNDGKSWRDPYNQYSIPTDIYNHGTHTVGSVLGKDGIGMAPKAQWIACKGYQDDGGATLAAFAECGQFMVCPTDPNGMNPDCTKSPHVTSNSWGVWPGTDFFEDVLDVWHSIGIIPLFSMGNEGPACEEMISPADSTKAIGVGATGQNDELASFSSRGPSRYGVLKPDISAPGVGIRSCDCRGDDLYIAMSGTSMSCPNAAGVATLMVAKNSDIAYDRLKSILETTAVQSSITNGQTCGGIPDTVWPNNAFGHGRLDAFAAVQAV